MCVCRTGRRNGYQPATIRRRLGETAAIVTAASNAAIIPAFAAANIVLPEADWNWQAESYYEGNTNVLLGAFEAWYCQYYICDLIVNVMFLNTIIVIVVVLVLSDVVYSILIIQWHYCVLYYCGHCTVRRGADDDMIFPDAVCYTVRLTPNYWWLKKPVYAMAAMTWRLFSNIFWSWP